MNPDRFQDESLVESEDSLLEGVFRIPLGRVCNARGVLRRHSEFRCVHVLNDMVLFWWRGGKAKL